MTSNERVVMCVTLTLCIVIVGMVGALIIAIFDPAVPDDAIFAIIGPAFQTVVGGFIGLITGIKIGQIENDV
jgi:hypothetical protein